MSGRSTCAAFLPTRSSRTIEFAPSQPTTRLPAAVVPSANDVVTVSFSELVRLASFSLYYSAVSDFFSKVYGPDTKLHYGTGFPDCSLVTVILFYTPHIRPPLSSTLSTNPFLMRRDASKLFYAILSHGAGRRYPPLSPAVDSNPLPAGGSP